MSSKLSSLLVQDGVVSVKRMEEAFQRQVIFGGSLDTILLEMNVLDEAALQKYLWASSKVPPADFGAIDFSAAQEQTQVFPQRLAEKYLIAPVRQIESTLLVLVTDPPDPGRLDELGFMLGSSIEPRIVPEFRLFQALERIYGVKMPLRYAGLVKRMGDPPVPDVDLPVEDSASAVQGAAPAVQDTASAAQDAAPAVQDAAPESTAPSTPSSAGVPGAAPAKPESASAPARDAPAGPEPASAPARGAPGAQDPPKEPAVESDREPGPPTGGVASGWEDPFAGAKPDTLVGVPVHAAPAAQPVGATDAPSGGDTIPPASEAEPTPPHVAEDETAAPEPTPEQRSLSTKQTAAGMPIRDLDAPLPVEPPEAVAAADAAATPAPEALPSLAPGEQPAPSIETPTESATPSPPAEPPVVTGYTSEAADERSWGEPAPQEYATPEASQAEPDAVWGAVGPQPMPSAGAPTALAHPSETAPVAEPAPEPAPGPGPAPEEDWPFDPTPLSFEEAVDQLQRCTTRDDIFSTLLRTIAGYFDYAAVFTVYGEQAVGRLSVRRGVPDASQIALTSIPLTLPSIFRATVESKGYYFGPIYDEGINFGVLADLERPVPASSFIMPVLIRNRVVCFVYADNGLHPVAAEIPESLVFISYQVSQAFQRLILRSKRERYSGVADTAGASGKISQRITVPQEPAQQGSWQASDASAEPAPSRAPQHEGVFADPTATPPDVAASLSPASGVQPAFPPLSPPQDEPPVTVQGSISAEDPGSETPAPEVAAPAEITGARAITSVGYYSLSEPHLEEDVRGSTTAGPPVHDGIAAGELETSMPGTPRAIQSDESPVRVDSSLATEPGSDSQAEDIWSLIDDLEQGGLEGDLAAAALQRLGDPALKLVAFRFPGRLSQDRMGQHGKLPPPSAHGPLLDFLVRVGAPAVSHLLGLLESENPEVRYYATYVFSELHAPAVVPQLLDRVFDSAPPVRRIVVEVFKRYAGTPELDAVLEHLRAELVGPVPFRKRCATEVLGTLRDVPAVPRLIELASDRDPETAETAQRALLLITKQAFGDSRRRWRSWWDKNQNRHRLQWLIDALGHKESECRFLASQELHRLTGETFGYRFDQDRRDREEAQRRWQRWWAERGQARFSRS